MALRIAFDLDGVLADMDTALIRQAEIIFGNTMTRHLPKGALTDVPPHDKPADDPPADREAPLARFPMTRRLQRRLWRHIESVENFWETLEEIEAGSLGKLGMSRPLLKFGGGSVEILHDVGD